MQSPIFVGTACNTVATSAEQSRPVRRQLA